MKDYLVGNGYGRNHPRDGMTIGNGQVCMSGVRGERCFTRSGNYPLPSCVSRTHG